MKGIVFESSQQTVGGESDVASFFHNPLKEIDIFNTVGTASLVKTDFMNYSNEEGAKQSEFGLCQSQIVKKEEEK
jgi:hypothetical protein